jgi:uncharacterized protein YjcR
MPAALDVNREAVRMLAIQVGVREAARRLDLAESTVQSWSEREKWFADPKKPPTMLVATNATSPAEELARELAKFENETKRGLALAARNMTAKAINAPLKQAGNVHKVAQTAAIVHGWNTDRREGDVVEINLLSIGGNVDLGRAVTPKSEDVGGERDVKSLNA